MDDVTHRIVELLIVTVGVSIMIMGIPLMDDYLQRRKKRRQAGEQHNG
jgi:Tfp pilus assembly protein FimT